MDGVSYTAASQTQAQTSLIALRESIEAQRQIAEMLSRQAQAIQPAANPPHLGNNVDTLV